MARHARQRNDYHEGSGVYSQFPKNKKLGKAHSHMRKHQGSLEAKGGREGKIGQVP